MSTRLWYLACAAGVILGPLVVLLTCLLILSLARTYKFVRRRGWQAELVPYTKPVELYYSSIEVDSQKVKCCLAEKRVEFKEHELDLGFGSYEHLEERALRINPNASVPTLVHDGHPVLETDDIIAYIDQHFEGPPLLPMNPQERTDVVRWIHASSMVPGAGPVDAGGVQRLTLGIAVRILSIPAVVAMENLVSFWSTLRAVLRHPNPLPEFSKLIHCIVRHFCSQPGIPSRPLARAAFAGVSSALAEIEERLTDGREYLVGASFSLADVCVAANLNRLELLGVLDIVAEKHTRFQQYWARVKARDSFGPAFRSQATHRATKELRSAFARFKKEVAGRGLVVAYSLEEDGEEEEE